MLHYFCQSCLLLCALDGEKGNFGQVKWVERQAMNITVVVIIHIPLFIYAAANRYGP